MIRIVTDNRDFRLDESEKKSPRDSNKLLIYQAISAISKGVKNIYHENCYIKPCKSFTFNLLKGKSVTWDYKNTFIVTIKMSYTY